MTHTEIPSTQVLSAQILCTLSDLMMYDRRGRAIASLDHIEPLTLSTSITFSDTANNEFVNLLMPSHLALKATFYARQLNPVQEIVLGSVIVNTVDDTVSYDLALDLPEPDQLGLMTNMSYQIGATVRVGTSPYGIPSIMRGNLEGVLLTIGTPTVKKSQADAVASNDVDAEAVNSESKDAEPTAETPKTVAGETKPSPSSRRKNGKKTA